MEQEEKGARKKGGREGMASQGLGAFPVLSIFFMKGIHPLEQSGPVYSTGLLTDNDETLAFVAPNPKTSHCQVLGFLSLCSSVWIAALLHFKSTANFWGVGQIRGEMGIDNKALDVRSAHFSHCCVQISDRNKVKDSLWLIVCADRSLWPGG